MCLHSIEIPPVESLRVFKVSVATYNVTVSSPIHVWILC